MGNKLHFPSYLKARSTGLRKDKDFPGSIFGNKFGPRTFFIGDIE